MYAYVTSVNCYEGPGGFGPLMNPPTCEECGGGPGAPTRQVVLTVVDLGTHTVAAQHLISETEPGCSARAPLENIGMAFSVDRGTLFVANPDQDRVEVLDTATHALGTPILVGTGRQPVDVAVAYKDGDPTKERAYVANRLGNTVTVIDVASLTFVREVLGTSGPVALVALSDGTKVFTMDKDAGTISIVNLLVEPEVNTRDLLVSTSVRRAALLQVP